MATFGLHDTYKVTNSKKTEKFSIDYKVLIRLYEPIIGSVASSLYLTLESELSLNKYQKESFTISRLTNLTQLTINSFNKAIEMLKDYDLITIQQSTKKQDDYLFKIKKTKSAEEFFENKKLYNALSVIVDDKYLSQIKEYFVNTSIDENDYIDIDDVYQINKMTEQEFYDSFCKKYEVISKSLVLDEKVKREIERIKNLFKLNYDEIEKALLQSIDFTSKDEMSVDLNKLNDIASKSITTNENKVDKKAFDFDSERAITYYQKLSGRTNLFPNEIEMFDRLLDEYKVSEGIINVITNYCFKYKNMSSSIPYNYYKKVIEAMQFNNVKNSSDAMEYFRNITKKQNTKVEIAKTIEVKKEATKEVKEETKIEDNQNDIYKELRDLMGD